MSFPTSHLSGWRMKNLSIHGKDGGCMQEYSVEDYVVELKGTENVSYVLKENESFFMTGYKVLQNQENRGLVNCARLSYNGKIKLVYFSSEYLPLPGIISYLDIVGIKTVLRNLIADILSIGGNGFLKCQNIDARPEKIFVDRNTLEVYLIYLPIKIVENGYDRNLFENELRTRLIRLLNSLVSLNGAEIKAILFELSNGSTSMEHLYQFLQQEDITSCSKDDMEPQKPSTGSLILESLDGKIHLKANGDEFVIGKSKEMADGVIYGNPAVSRKHCKILKRNGTYRILDLGSSNGTYINGRRLAADKEVAVKQGDRIKIANIEFEIR